MRLLSKELVSLDYRKQLQVDMARATVCRFLIAYVSVEGLDSIGRHLLTKVLSDPRSFGTSSLSCSCGYEALLKLQAELGDSANPRLKYFMDPLVGPAEGEPRDLALFHSKLVYLYLPKENKSVVYIGSHNWTKRALGPGKPRNAEASLRIEVDFAPEHLDGTGSSMLSEVNRHLLQAFNLPACLPATTDNRPRFEEWYAKGCRRAPSISLQEITVILSILKPGSTNVSPQQWQALQGDGIYLQALNEDEGQMLWRSNDNILVLVWRTESDLRQGEQPIILHCRVTTSKAGPGSQLRGTNLSSAPIAGFHAILFDEDQLLGLQKTPSTSTKSSVTIWSGRSVEIYDFEFPTLRADSSQVDGRFTPPYQFYLEVEHVAFPAESEYGDTPELVWERQSFAVAQTKEAARYEEVPGYMVSEETKTAILTCLYDTLLVDVAKVKVLPVVDYEHSRIGKRLSNHPLHETFIGRTARIHKDKLYGKAMDGGLVADLDMPEASEVTSRSSRSTNEAVQRVQRVFTMPLADLETAWADMAKRDRLTD